MEIRDDRALSYFGLWQDYSWSYRYQDRNQTSVTLRVILNTSYAGKYIYLHGKPRPWMTKKFMRERKDIGLRR